MVERQCLGCPNISPCNCKQTASLWSPISGAKKSKFHVILRVKCIWKGILKKYRRWAPFHYHQEASGNLRHNQPFILLKWRACKRLFSRPRQWKSTIPLWEKIAPKFWSRWLCGNLLHRAGFHHLWWLALYMQKWVGFIYFRSRSLSCLHLLDELDLGRDHVSMYVIWIRAYCF